MRDTPLLVVRILIAVIIGLGGVTVHLNYINGRISKNESQTIFFLKGISSTQAQVQASGAIDQLGRAVRATRAEANPSEQVARNSWFSARGRPGADECVGSPG